MTMTVTEAIALADHASPMPHLAGQALKVLRDALRAERESAGAISVTAYQQWVDANWNRRGYAREYSELRDLFIMGLGIGGEAGEVQELLKKHVRDGREILDDLRLELGDVLHYLTRIASQFGMTLPEIMAANHAKIEARHAKRMAQGERVECGGCAPPVIASGESTHE